MKISIYAIVPIEGNDEDPPLYIGSTTNLKNRNYAHKTKCNNPNDKEYNKPLYKFIRDNGGLDNFIMVELVSEEVETKQEALELERTYIKLLGPTLNKRIPGKYLEMGRKEYDKEHNKHYREDNKEKIKEYYEANKEQLKKQMREINSQKIICPHCNIEFMKGGKTMHIRTKKHQQNIQKQANTE